MNRQDIERLRAQAAEDLRNGLDARSINAEVNLWGADRTLQLDKDKEAEQAYLISEVEPNTKHFDSEHERVHWLVEHQYYEQDLIDKYDDEFIDDIHDREHDMWVSFGSFMGVFKFYQQYAMRTGDGKTYLEDFVERSVAVALKLAEGDTDFAVRIADAIVSREYQPATPTFLNAGKVRRGEYTSCFLIRIEDNMESIGRSVNSALQLSKRGGGVALLLSNLREQGAPIKGIEGQASGVVPVMKILEDSFSYANQLGARQGAGAVYLHMNHPDILRFLDTKRENADEKIRIKTLSMGIVVPDVAFRLAKENKDMALFSPYGLQKYYHTNLADIGVSSRYDELADDDRVVVGHVNVRKLFTTIAELQFESGYPYLMFEDTVNKANPLDGRIVMSNLCVTGDTRLLTDGGYVPIKQLHDGKVDFNVIVDERARTMNLDAEGLSTQKSTKAVLTKHDAEVFNVITHNGYSLKATAWHKMYVVRDGELLKIPLSEVQLGDKVLTQPEEGSFGGIHEPELAYIDGVIAADGTITESMTSAGMMTSSARIYLYDRKQVFEDSIEKMVSDVIINHDVDMQRQSTEHPKFLQSSDNCKHLHSAPLAKILKDYGITKSNKISVPEFVMQGDRDTQIAFLSGVFQFDGCITGSGPSIQLASINDQFVHDIQLLLVNFGINSSIYHLPREVSELPDGHGGSKEYPVKDIHRIYINGKKYANMMYDLLAWSPWEDDAMKTARANYKSDKAYNVHAAFSEIVSIDSAGVEDVYDVCVENGHSIIFNGIATGNCSEILQIQEPSSYHADLSYEHVGLDVSCNLGSLNIAHAFEGGHLGDTIDTAMRSLIRVSELTDTTSVPSLRRANETMHTVGLGQMNLHGFLMSHGIQYGSPEALDFVDAYFRTVAYHAYRTNNRIAQEKGSSFDGFTLSRYADGSYFDKFIERSHPISTDVVKALFAQYHVEVPSADDWEALKNDVIEYGLYAGYQCAVPPTGSISYLSGATSSIHPAAAAIEIRKEGKTGRVYYPAYGLNNDNANEYKDAYQIGPKAIIDTYAAATPYVDQGMSLTLFYPDTATTRDLVRNYTYAWRNGIKTLYYSRIRQNALAGTEVDANASECLSCQL